MLAGCGGNEEQPVDKPTPVRIQRASNGPAVPPIDTSGVVATKHEMRLSFKMGGVVRRIQVQDGDVVKKGQRLAEIELTEVDAQVEQARQMAEKAERDLRRGENLYADQVISLEQLQDLRTQASVATAQYKSAQFNQGYSVITAPRDGVVLRKLVEERELVPAGTPVLLFGESARGFVVRAALADREIVNVKLGDKGEIRMDAFPASTLTGTIVEIASAADERSGMFPIEVHFDAPPPRLVSGLVARLRLTPNSEAPGLTYIPMAALVEARRRSRQRVRREGRHRAAPQRARRVHHRRQHRARERTRGRRGRGHRWRAVPRKRRERRSPARNHQAGGEQHTARRRSG